MTNAVQHAQDVILALLAERAPGATICPSEAARALAAPMGAGPVELDWRDMMPLVHAAVDRLLRTGQVRISWKGRALPSRAGPYRIGFRSPA